MIVRMLMERERERETMGIQLVHQSVLVLPMVE